MSESTLNVEKEPTAEEVAQFTQNMKQQKKELLQFYKEELPLLRQQAEYENLVTQIEAAGLERLKIRMTKAHLMAPPAKDGEKEVSNEEPKKERTLRREE